MDIVRRKLMFVTIGTYSVKCLSPNELETLRSRFGHLKSGFHQRISISIGTYARAE